MLEGRAQSRSQILKLENWVYSHIQQRWVKDVSSPQCVTYNENTMIQQQDHLSNIRL